jgi:hypothetical protein
MLGSGWLGLLKGLAAILCILGIVSLALIYFIPAPPSTILIATSQPGGGYEFFGPTLSDDPRAQRRESGVAPHGRVGGEYQVTGRREFGGQDRLYARGHLKQ